MDHWLAGQAVPAIIYSAQGRYEVSSPCKSQSPVWCGWWQTVIWCIFGLSASAIAKRAHIDDPIPSLCRRFVILHSCRGCIILNALPVYSMDCQCMFMTLLTQAFAV